MSDKFEFIAADDKPALLAFSTPEWLDIVRTSVQELGYKVHTAATHGDFITSFSQVAYQIVVIEECFAADTAPENRGLLFLQSGQMQLRRHSTIILVGDSFTSFNPLQAFQHGVHLVVNRSEMLLLIQFIQKVVADNDMFLHGYRETQRRIAHGLGKV